LAATPETVRQGEAQLGIRLPPDYVEFITAMNGGEGFVGDNYVILWSVDELPRFNREYNVPEFAPGLVMFGSDGGGEGFGFDLRSQNARVVVVPFIGMGWTDAEEIAPSFREFLEKLSRGSAI
jgi:cell wall assembly regulator SMI1